MAAVRTRTHPALLTPAPALLALTELDASSIAGFANQLLAGIMVVHFHTLFRGLNMIAFVGTCHQISQEAFACSCSPGWQGLRCSVPVNLCANVTCSNNGVCRSSWPSYTCQCLSESYSGHYCETQANVVTERKILSKSFAYIAIIAMSSVVTFVVVMDVLKYFFGIDPVSGNRTRSLVERKRRNPVVVRFTYVHAPVET